MPQPELLYLSPVVPSLTGNGLAMRAGMVLEALTRRYSVSLLVVRLRASPENEVPEHFVRICRRRAALSVPLKAPGWWRRFRSRQPGLTELLSEYQAASFDVIHVFRLAMLPFSRRFLPASPDARTQNAAWKLDLDEVESAMHDRVAELCRQNGDEQRAISEEAAALQAKFLERQVCAKFQRVYVSSREEKERFSALYPACNLAVLPNAARFSAPLPPPLPGAVFSFLFVGTLGYYPNEDAVLHLCRDIVPRIRQRTRLPFQITIAGSGASAALLDAVRQAGLEFVGPVADIRPCYQGASAVLVPLRVAAGTRIKILEAWAYRRPVVATATGIEGLPARDETHALIASTPQDFADRCVRLMEDPTLAAYLAENAYELGERSFSLEAIERAIAAPDGQTH